MNFCCTASAHGIWGFLLTLAERAANQVTYLGTPSVAKHLLPSYTTCGFVQTWNHLANIQTYQTYIYIYIYIICALPIRRWELESLLRCLVCASKAAWNWPWWNATNGMGPAKQGWDLQRQHDCPVEDLMSNLRPSISMPSMLGTRILAAMPCLCIKSSLKLTILSRSLRSAFHHEIPQWAGYACICEGLCLLKDTERTFSRNWNDFFPRRSHIALLGGNSPSSWP